MRVMYNLKHRLAIRLEFGDIFLTSRTKLALEAKASICSTIKENLILYCRKFSALFVVVFIQHIFIRPVSQRNTAYNRNN